MGEDYIKHIHLASEDILGRHPLEGTLDLLNIMFVGLKDQLAEKDEKFRLHRLLRALLSENLNPKEKLTIMNEEYEIPIEQNIRKEVDEMYTMTQYIKEKWQNKGWNEGRNELDVEYILGMHQNGLTLEQIANISKKTIKEVESILKDKKPLLS